MKKLRLALLTIVLSALILSGALIPHVAALGVIEPGFPIMVTTTGGGEPSGPGMNVLAANIDADPALEIVLPIQTGGPLAAWNADASPVSGWPVPGPNVMGMSAAGNINPTLPGMEVVTLYALHYTTTAEVYAYSTFGDVLPGFPVTLPSTVTTAPILADVDGNGLDEIFVGAKNGKVYAYDAAGAPLAGWPLSLPGENAGAPVIVDLDGSGDLEMVVTYSDPGLLPTGYLTVLRFSDQTPLPGFPVSFRRDQFTTPFPVVGDVDGDSQLEVVVGAEATPTFYPIIRVYSRSGALESEMRHPDLFSQTSSAPALADLDGDSVPEILAQSRYGVSVWYGNGTPFPGWPVWSGEWHRNTTPVVGDVTGDQVPEVVVAAQRGGDCERGDLWIYDRNGHLLPNFPMYLPMGATGVPAIADIDLDGRNEIVITSSVRCNSYTVTAPKVWAFDLGGAPSGAIQWGQFNNGPRHRGVYTPPPTFVDLALSMSDSPDPTIATSTTTYTLTVTNAGSGMAHDVQVNDTLPSGATLIQALPSQGSCNTVNGIVTCGLGDMPNGATATVVLNVSYPQAGSMTNTASVATVSSESTLSNNIASQSTSIQPGSNLALNMTADRQRYTEGSTILYTLTLNNAGPNEANNVYVMDRLPTTLTHVSSTASQGSYNPTSGEWTVGTLANGQTVTLTITATVNANVGTIPIDNTAQVSNFEPADPNLANNSVTVRINVDIADLSVTLDVNNFTPIENANVTFTLTVRNNGTGLASGVSLNSALPAGLTYVSSNAGQGTYNSTTGLWTVGTINVSQSVTLTLVAHVNIGAAGQTITHQASISSSDQVDRVAYNDQQSVVIYVNGVQLQVNGSLSASSGAEGSTVTFTVTVTNNSVNSATGIVVAAPLPAGVTHHSDTPSQGSYESISGTWQVGTLAPSASANLAVTATVNAGTAGQVLAFSGAISQLDQQDYYAGDNTVTRQFTVMSANLRILMTVNNLVPKEGNSVSFTITVTNLGPFSTTGVEAVDLLPMGLTYVSHTVNRGAYTPATGIWAIGSLSSSQAATLTLTTTVNSGTSGTLISNTAQITASSLPDPNPANNNTAAVIGVGGVDVSLLLSVDKAMPGEGENVVYTLTLDTVGNDPATNVVVEDILPGGLTYVSSTASAGSYDNATGLWTIPTVPGTSIATLQITASVNTGTTGTTIANQAQIVSGDQYDPNIANNIRTVNISVGQADLALTMTVDDTTPDPDANVTYTLTVTNNATYAVTGIAVTDILPGSLTFALASGSYEPQTGVWTVGTLNGGASASLNITATVGSTLYSVQINNTATISASSNPDPNYGNNTRMVTINTTSLDLRISITDSADTVYLGGSFSYTITVVNLGSLTATGVVVTDTLPSEVTLVSATTTQGSGCTASGLLVTCNLGTIAPGGNAQATINVTVNADFTGRLSTWATVSADQPESNTDNNTDTETTGITNLIVSVADDGDDTVCSAAHCSLREAILAANALPGLDTIRFNITGPGPHTIRPNTLLPTITSPIVIDGTSEPSYSGAPVIELSGTFLTLSGQHGLVITAGGSTVRSLVINGFGGEGIRIETNGGNTIVSSYIGTNVAGSTAQGNHRGIYISNAANNVIGGPNVTDRNLISGNRLDGIHIVGDPATGNTIQGNLIGTDITGTLDLGNGERGINLRSSSNLIGGTTPGARNIISGNNVEGVLVGSGANNNLIQGNYVGTDVTGSLELGNVYNGIRLFSGQDNRVGGTTPEARNIISGNEHGIEIAADYNGPMRTIITGNYIGTDVTGAIAVGNSTGIYTEMTGYHRIGGTAPGEGNLISGNTLYGLDIRSDNNTIQGNLIGTDVTGMLDLGNGQEGVRLYGYLARNNLVGGTTPEARNIIAGNNGSGVTIEGDNRMTANRIQGNYVGLNIVGEPLGNNGYGVWVYNETGNTIGGTQPGAGNVIANNGNTGVHLHRVGLYSTSHITLNTAVLSNSIYANGGLGIELLHSAGPNANDTGDGDYESNYGQNYPALTEVIVAGSTMQITGSLDSDLSKDYRLEFFSNDLCDVSGYGEGQYFLGAANVSIGATSPVTFNVTLENVTFQGEFIVATATDPNNNTSEFSDCIGPAGVDTRIAMSASDTGVNVGDSVNYTLIVTNNGPSEATGIQVQALLPAGLTYQSDDSGGAYTPGTGEWAVGTLAKNASATLTINAVVEVGTVGSTITFPVTIAAVAEVDLNPANNQASVTLSVGIADLDLLSEVDSIAPNEGDTITYYTIIANTGPSDATGIAASSPLPAGVTFVDRLMTQGSYDETTGEWLVGSLDNGDEASLTVIVTVDAGMQGSNLTNTAAITTVDQADPNTANNTDGKSVPVGFADIGVQSMVDNAMPGSGEPVNMTVIVSNGGPSDATNLVIESPLPLGVDLDTASATTGVYSETESRWTVAGLSRGNQAVLTLAGTVSAGAGGNTLSSTARVIQLGQIDQNTANDTASVQLNVEPETDLAITSAFNPSSAIPSATVTLTITVSNSGPMAADDVTVQDMLPVGLNFVSASADRGLYDRFIGVWSVGSLDVSETATLTITMTIQAGAPVGTISNTASIQGASIADQNLSNNTVTSNLTVQAIPSVPILLLPASGASTTSRQPAFTWNPAPDAVGYELQLGIGNPPSSTVFSGSATRYTPPAPLLTTTYYWRVRSVNADGNFSAWSAVRSVSITSPSSAAPGRNLFTTSTPTLTWGRVSWSAGYEIQIDNNSSFASPEYTSGLIPAETLSHTLTSPLPNGAWYWRARARRADGAWGPWSTADSFVIAAQ